MKCNNYLQFWNLKIFQDLIEVLDVKPIKIVQKSMKLNGEKRYRILPPFKKKFKIHLNKSLKLILITTEDSVEFQKLMTENIQMNKAISIFNLDKEDASI